MLQGFYLVFACVKKPFACVNCPFYLPGFFPLGTQNTPFTNPRSRHIFHTHHLHILINNLPGGLMGSVGRRGGLGGWLRVPGGLDSGHGSGLLARHVP